MKTRTGGAGRRIGTFVPRPRGILPCDNTTRADTAISRKANLRGDARRHMILHAIVRGRVQGVGFRYWVLEQARAQGLKGWVRNCPDGTVEVEAEGT